MARKIDEIMAQILWKMMPKAIDSALPKKLGLRKNAVFSQPFFDGYIFFVPFWWRWGESNPRPKAF